MEEILLEDDERDSIEYRILMAYAQRRLSVSRYGKLLKNEANVQKSSSLIRRRAEIQLQGGWVELQGRKEANPKYHPGYRLPVLCGRAEQENPQTLSLHQGETADVNHIADKLVKLVASRSQEPLSDQSFRITCQNRTLCEKQDDSDPTVGSEGEEHDEEKIIQTIVSLLRQSGDQLEEKIKKDRVFYQCFKDMLSYPFFKRITDVFLEDVSADSTREPGGHTQCTKVAFTMEVATRLTAVDNHPMNLVLGFGLKYLREHFKPWIQDQGGWEKALTSLDQEEVE
ncbi:Apoptosis facilitator Bcl-2-like 14 [Balearica regulorum gibbericeps]|uniref:Apoptosis facilitator Bcl-2-like 14 n=1 Tax=Balearica regulorum gibbericeps TaxID=100784 RepID=A0A087VDV2_BALRE|nr:Apoptosis facilitator Bcl-2-like 14 [Balearica regulorum gibbericeps]